MGEKTNKQKNPDTPHQKKTNQNKTHKKPPKHQKTPNLKNTAKAAMQRQHLNRQQPICQYNNSALSWFLNMNIPFRESFPNEGNPEAGFWEWNSLGI